MDQGTIVALVGVAIVMISGSLAWLLKLTADIAQMKSRADASERRLDLIADRHEDLAKELRSAVGELTSAVSELRAIVGLLRERIT